MNGLVVVDASLAFKWLVEEEHSDKADALGRTLPALAETLDCDLWTADEKFYRAASPVTDNIRWLAEFVAPG